MLVEYVRTHAIRGACTCGKCFDAPENPEQKQPEGHTADVFFFQIAGNGAEKQVFENLIGKEFPHWLDGKEHSYIEMGADIGDQGLALMTMGLGKLLNTWDLLTPKLLPIPEDLQQQMAGIGMITIKAPR